MPPLADLLPVETAVLALAAPAPITVSLDVLAASYAAAVRDDAGGTAVVLAGWSLGGVLALAVARHLEAAGVAVRHVSAIDPWTATEAPAPSDVELAQAFVLDLAGAGAVPDGMPSLPDQVEAVFAWACAAGLVPKALDGAALQERFRVFVSLYRALLAHRPAMPQASVSLYRATEQARAIPGLAPLDAKGLAREVPLKADHYHVVRSPHLDRIAADMKCVLLNGTESLVRDGCP